MTYRFKVSQQDKIPVPLIVAMVMRLRYIASTNYNFISIEVPPEEDEEFQKAIDSVGIRGDVISASAK